MCSCPYIFYYSNYWFVAVWKYTRLWSVLFVSGLLMQRLSAEVVSTMQTDVGETVTKKQHVQYKMHDAKSTR